MRLSTIITAIDDEYDSLYNLVYGELVNSELPLSDDTLATCSKSLTYYYIENDKDYYGCNTLSIVECNRTRQYHWLQCQDYDHKVDVYFAMRDSCKNVKCDRYVHVFNEKVENWEAYLEHFQDISGEVCASKLGESLYSYRKNTIGIVLEGTPTASFDFDCWSKQRSNGFRVATRSWNNSCHTEHWLIPALCKVKAVIVKKYDRSVAEAAKNLNIAVQYLK